MFAGRAPDEPLPSLALRAAETVFELYTEDPEVARLRFALVGSVPALRDREAASVHHYRRLFTPRAHRAAGRPPGRRAAGRGDGGGTGRRAQPGAAPVAGRGRA
ncbi:hypothetical protein HX744_03830 [Pseudonocardia sp. ICBG1122]|nr:hypothetical protein [Pseudonocardia pini]